MERRQIVLWVLLCLALGVAVLSVVRYRKLEQEKQVVQRLLDETSQALYQSEEEKAHLNADLATTSAQLSTANQQVGKLQSDLTQAQTQMGQMETQIALLNKRQRELEASNAALTGQVAGLQSDKQALEARLGSLDELRKAIKEVKVHMKQERIQVRLARIETFKQQDQEKLRRCNRGFFVRDGVPTSITTRSYRVRVLPAESVSQ